MDSFAEKKETESKFETLLKEFHELKKESEQRWRELKEESDRKWQESERKWEEALRKWEESERRWEKIERKWEESERKWQELKEESERKWQESERKWRELKQESDQRWETLLKEIHRVDKRIDRTIGALGARWGINSEKVFREAIEAALSELTDLKVENYLSYDEKGEVFGHPDQIELDVIIKNGEVWVIEIKSSMSKADMYIFDRKVKFFEKKEGKRVNRKLVISPMIEPKAYEVAKKLGIEAYSVPEDVGDEEK
ncbi:PD-(D/E)XK nuclease family protein [Desulfothermus naphthae]